MGSLAISTVCASPSPSPRLVLSPSGEAVEFETVISPAGVLPGVQRLKMGQAMAGQAARVWAGEVAVHVTAGARLVVRRAGRRNPAGGRTRP